MTPPPDNKDRGGEKGYAARTKMSPLPHVEEESLPFRAQSFLFSSGWWPENLVLLVSPKIQNVKEPTAVENITL